MSFPVSSLGRVVTTTRLILTAFYVASTYFITKKESVSYKVSECYFKVQVRTVCGLALMMMH